jgi:hypothetical protein
MRRMAAPLSLFVAALMGGCTCGAKRPSAAERGDAARATASASAVALERGDEGGAAPSTLAVFSAPLAAARVGGMGVVAGLVAAEGVVRVVARSGGRVAWMGDVLRGIHGTPDAELRMQRADDGVVLVWRGALGGEAGRTAVVLGPHGEARGEPFPVGAAWCATTEAIAWIEPQRGAAARVLARRWADAQASLVATVPADRDPGLLCGDHALTVLGDGDDDLTAMRLVPGEAARPSEAVILRQADFGGDEEREHHLYSVGDDLGLVRLAASGAVAWREVRRTGAPTPWRRLDHAIAADDDIVAIDGDAAGTLVVTTHETDESCPDVSATAASVRALRIDRSTGAEAVLDLAPADCERSPGPFWIAAAPGGAPAVAWVERRAGPPPRAAPIDAVVVRVLRPDGVRAGRVDVVADAVADGGCDDRGCMLAALARPPGGDGMGPAPIRVLGYAVER